MITALLYCAALAAAPQQDWTRADGAPTATEVGRTDSVLVTGTNTLVNNGQDREFTYQVKVTDTEIVKDFHVLVATQLDGSLKGDKNEDNYIDPSIDSKLHGWKSKLKKRKVTSKKFEYYYSFYGANALEKDKTYTFKFTHKGTQIGSSNTRVVVTKDGKDLVKTDNQVTQYELLGPYSLLASFSGHDDFGRPNGPLGGDWMDEAGSQIIENGRGGGVLGQGNAWASHTIANSPYEAARVEFDLHPSASGSNLCYAAAVTGQRGADMLFTKVQAQGGPLFNHAGFYVGFNGGGLGGYGGFFAITPVTGGRVTTYVTNAGDTMNLDIDENYDGVVDHHYESSGILGLGLDLGSGVGLGTYDDVRYDNWELNDGATPAFDLEISGLAAGGQATVKATGAAAGLLVGVAYSLSGDQETTVSPANCGSLIVDLSQPIRTLFVQPADAQGEATAFVNVPASLSGTTIWFQALELLTCRVSQGYEETVL